ncbi:hypothetical protein lbkm_1409 [Lachnospiraceae bacterium KM106-2]|nr:hypothetical protein lbkm_1409 [Lachnospiraceae bacterium KM106-2]
MRKRLVSAVVLVIVIGIGIVVCHNWQSSELMIKKDKNYMIEKAKQTASLAEAEDRRIVKLRKYSYQDAFSNKKKNLKVTLDLSAIIDENMAYPITKVEQRVFTNEDLKEFQDVFMGKQKVYKTTKELTDSDIIAELQCLAHQKLTDPSGIEGADRDSIGEEIKLLQKMMITAKAKETAIETKLTLEKIGNGTYFSGYSIGKDHRKQYLVVENQCKSGKVSLSYTNLTNAADYGFADLNLINDHKKKKLPEITKNEAKKKANELMDQLHINDRGDYGIIQVREATSNRQGREDGKEAIAYNVIYTRKISGITSNLSTDRLFVDNGNRTKVYDFLSRTNEISTVTAEMDQIKDRLETICIYVDDSGVVAFKWNAPSVILKQEVEKSSLLPFEQLKEIIKKMVLVVKASELDDKTNYTIHCDKLELGLAKIDDKKDETKGMYVPVWNIWGTYTIKHKKSTVSNYEKILTINAVDGSVITEEE